MPRNRFVDPNRIRLQISEDDWLEVKSELNVGEQKLLEAAGVRRVADGVEIVWEDYQIKRAAVWITDWSFQDSSGKQQEVSLEALRALDVETFAEVQAALNVHIASIVEKKKVRMNSSPTSR